MDNSQKEFTTCDNTPESAYGGTGNMRTKTLQRVQIINTFNTMKIRMGELCNMSVHQLEVKLSLLERQLQSFEKLQNELESLDESEIGQNHRFLVEEIYYEIKSVILERLALQRASVAENTFSSTHITAQSPGYQRPVLPTLQLSKFSGKYQDWMEFYNVFCLLVHDNQDLSPVSKFQYLKSCLRDSAAHLIQSLEVTSTNYEVAFNLLKSRYNNKEQLFQSHLSELFTIQKVTNPSVQSLRLFIDNINANMRALETIASKEQIAEGIILHVIISKLDTELQAKWEDSQASTLSSTASSSTPHLPDWDDLSTFLERRCKSLEIYESSPSTSHKIQQQNSRPRHSKIHHTYTPKHQATSFLSATQQSKCVICDTSPYHSVFRCPKFVDMNIPDRFKTVKRCKLCMNCLGTNHVANSCPSFNRCLKCRATHHTLLHKENETSEAIAQGAVSNNMSNPTSCLQISEEKGSAILATAMVELKSSSGASMMVRALLDSCSQSNFITERIAQRLRLSRKKININICGIGGKNSVGAKHSCSLTATGVTTGYVTTLDAIIIPSISSWHPQKHINISDWTIPANIKLADQSFNVPAPVDLLIGVELFWDLLMVGRIKPSNQPNLIKTKFGWVISGATDIQADSSKTIAPQDVQQKTIQAESALLLAENKIQPLSSPCENSLEGLLQLFWKLENIEPNQNYALENEEDACEQLFKATTRRCSATNKFIVRLPFKVTPPILGESRQIAQRRFAFLEARFARNNCIKKEYVEFLNEYRALNHMRPTTPQNVCYYIPHHCVVKPDSSTTRLRVVFDASSSTTNGSSLNDLLHAGPTLQDDVFKILIRFRYHKFVLVADIAKMYRQILVDDEDKKWQGILWRNTVNDPLLTYELQTLTYGTRCAPYLAVKCLQQLAKEEIKNHPIGSLVTLRDFYVDNLMTGGNTEDEVIEIKQQVVALLANGGFPLRKFASNSEKVLCDTPESDREVIVTVDDMQYVKTLGLQWSPSEDVFHFSYPSKNQRQNVTKRSILSHTASFFDPLGFINPLIVRCKILMQDLWKLQLHWDESVPNDVFSEWTQICNELQSVHQLKIPRYVICNTQTVVHLFVDASTKAYGACVYAVTKNSTSKSSSLICAKSRVAPTKIVSLPRLELCSALLGSQLLHSIKTQFPVEPQNIFCWSDSMIALSWIAGDAHRWPTFVANRVTKIQQLTKNYSWRHVPSELNPADLLSRGTTVKAVSNSFWLNGPDFLLLGNKSWPNHQSLSDIEGKDLVIETSLIASKSEDIVGNQKYVNSYEKLLRIFSYANRFIKACRKQAIVSGPIQVNELQSALLLICQLIQGISFSDEIKCISNKRTLSNKSRLLQLSPFLDNGILRVGGRLQNSSLPFSSNHPILLPNSHPYVITIITYFHRKHLHAGPLTLHNILRDTFWIINGKNLIKKIVHNCILCYRCRPVTETQVMGSLPAHRVEQSSPFNISGVDYCGPFLVSSQIRGRGPKKVYLAIFICFSVKAVHFELVPDLTTQAFISALKRFVSRRGYCSVIYSDNATNFIGANRELRSLLQGFMAESHNEVVREACLQDGIVWKLIPPRSPHFGGLWESAVKQAKHYIRRVVGNLVLCFDDLHTVCCQAEAIINSRPLTPLSSDPNDYRSLTPAHFLVGRLLTTIPEPSILTDNPISLKKYQMVQWIQQQFWDRWRNEYLKLLQLKTKWATTRVNLNVNDLVILKEENTPPLKWPLARVVQCSPGNDGIVRVVTVKTADGTFKRAITQICRLPLNN